MSAQTAFEQMQRAFAEVQRLGMEIESGAAWWRTFELHKVAQEEYGAALTRYLSVA